MPVALDFFLKYGYLILFLWVMVEQIGFPVPSVPLILTAGTLAATHKMHWQLALVSVLAGCLFSDSLWYALGRRHGGSMVRLLCRISMEPGTCVRRTEDIFGRHGASALLWAKFVPGLSTVAAPIAGQSRMSYHRFLFFDTLGSLFWAGAWLTMGAFFGDALKRNANLLHWVGRSAGVLVALLVIGFVIFRAWKQHRFLKQIATARLAPEILKQMIETGENPFIVDLRHPLDYLPDPRVLPGAIRLTPEELVHQSDHLPRDRDVILYCTCPSDASSAKMALALRKIGISRVRPLHGGFDAWKQLGYPLVDILPQTASTILLNPVAANGMDLESQPVGTSQAVKSSSFSEAS